MSADVLVQAARPDHIPAEAVYELDIHRDAGLLSDPHARISEILRDAPPVFWTSFNGGSWIVAGYQEVYAASRDFETFSSSHKAGPDSPQSGQSGEVPGIASEMPHIPTPTPIDLDPPEHTKYRSPLNPIFSPKAILARREEIRTLADSLLDRVVDKGGCDFIPEVAEPLPVQVFLKMMGLPLERQAEFRQLVHGFLAPLSGDPHEMITRLRSVADAMKDVIEARREKPRDDLISILWAAEIDGKAMTHELMEDFGVLLFVAGLDTVINGIGYGIRHLATHPELQRELRENPRLIVEAAEEILRRYTFTIPVRRVVRDTVFAGWQMKQGDRLALFLPGADLDAREFAAPESFDLGRENKAHIAFGVGPHRCLGSHLARIELQVVYEQVLARLPEFRLDDSRPVKFHGGNILAIDSLPIRWD